jgi:hypothetical protein
LIVPLTSNLYLMDQVRFSFILNKAFYFFDNSFFWCFTVLGHLSLDMGLQLLTQSTIFAIAFGERTLI